MLKIIFLLIPFLPLLYLGYSSNKTPEATVLALDKSRKSEIGNRNGTEPSATSWPSIVSNARRVATPEYPNPALASLPEAQSHSFARLTGSNNELFGAISLPKASKWVARGHAYNKDGSQVMHSGDPRADPNRNVIVSLHPLDFRPALPPTAEAVITQKEQTFLPCVLPVTVGSTVYFINEDQFVHSIYSMTLRNIAIGRRPPGEMHPRKIAKPGVVQLTCDIHTHMRGVILSLETPYFTRADAEGRYRLRGLPDGRYRVEVYHLDAGKRTANVVLSGGQPLRQDFDYTQP